jgi:phage shock protein PspC (stress-responsive transcriptional regulator)
MNCNDAVAALVASLESGTPMTDEQREHIRTCARCRELLDSAKQFQTILGGNGIQPPEVDATALAAERVVRRAKTRRTLLIGLAIAVVSWIGLSLLLIRAGEAPPAEAFAVAGMGIGIASLIALPVMLLLLLAHAARSSSDRWYKRLKPGRQISGVCLGLSERFKLNVSMVRLAFFVGIFVDGVGLWVYLILALAMPVHPDDRQYLLRFRLRRWFARRTAHAEHHVQ